MRRESNVGVVLEVEPRPQRKPIPVSDDTPFRIAVLADLGGGRSPFRPRPIRVDRDNFDDVLSGVAPKAVLGLGHGGEPVVVAFDDLDDFHPDALRARLPVFRTLRELRARLDDPRTFEATARELLGEPPEAPAGGGAEDADAGEPPPPSGGLLDMMVDAAVGPPSPDAPPLRPARPPRDDLQEYIHSIVTPHIVPGEDPRKSPLLDRLDEAAGTVMRRVLHDPAFQAIEAAWRALFLLVRRIETGTDLTLHVIDASSADVVADLAVDRELERTELYRVLVEEAAGTAGSQPWSLVIGDYTFGPSPTDVRLLARFASIARHAGAPFIAGAHPSLAGCPGFEQTPDPATWDSPGHTEWDTFRRSPVARHVGLVLPRFILRLPYGEDSDECDTFAFEEMDAEPVHEHYLWGNAAYACAVMLAESFARAGWAMRPGMDQDLGGLPLHIRRHTGEPVAMPCAESLMTERAAARLTDAGLMPLASLKDRDAVRLVRFQSVADPRAALTGRWRSPGS